MRMRKRRSGKKMRGRRERRRRKGRKRRNAKEDEGGKVEEGGKGKEGEKEEEGGKKALADGRTAGGRKSKVVQDFLGNLKRFLSLCCSKNEKYAFATLMFTTC